MPHFAKTVFVLGAGVNKTMTNWAGISKPVSPPLMKDFFIVVSRLNKFNNHNYRKYFRPVYDFIQEHWALTICELSYTHLNIEDCFSLLELKFAQAKRDGDHWRASELFSIQFKLKRLLTLVLAEFDGVESTGVMRAFGQLLFQLKPVIITFNYDCFIESVIRTASGQSEHQPARTTSKTEISDSYWNWNMPRGYGIEFDYVLIHDRFTHHPLRRRYVDGKTFYLDPKNRLYPWHILKLHGSLNWFRYVPAELFSSLVTVDSMNTTVGPSHRSDIILGHLGLLKNESPKINDMFVDPVIVTPGFSKEDQYASLPDPSKIMQLWSQAEDALAHCKYLVVIGYSFPPTDHDIRSLFKRALSRNLLEKLIVVNPDDIHANMAFQVCKFESSVRYMGLKEFLNHQRGLDSLIRI